MARGSQHSKIFEVGTGTIGSTCGKIIFFQSKQTSEWKIAFNEDFKAFYPNISKYKEKI